jgi:acyl transferase domain-containing protein
MARDLEQGSKHGVVGMTSLLSGRLSWFFNLLGPCLTLDTACSSSLVALDLGCQTLYTGASDMVSGRSGLCGRSADESEEHCDWLQSIILS